MHKLKQERIKAFRFLAADTESKLQAELQLEAPVTLNLKVIKTVQGRRIKVLMLLKKRKPYSIEINVLSFRQLQNI